MSSYYESLSYFEGQPPRPEPLVAVFRVLGERIASLEERIRLEEQLRQGSDQTSAALRRELDDERRKTAGVEEDRARWRERAVEVERKLEEATLPPDVVAVIAAARGALDGPTNHRLRKLRLALHELDRERTLEP